MPETDLIEVTDLMSETSIIFHGRTFVTREIYNKIIEPSGENYNLLDSRSDRLRDIFMNRNEIAIDMRTPRLIPQVSYFTYSYPSIRGFSDEFHVKMTLDYREGNGKIILEMDHTIHREN